MKGDGGVAGEGRVVGVPKLHSWGKCSMPLTNINSDWMSNASSGLCIILGYIIYAGPLCCILGCNYAGPLRWHGRPSAEVNENINLGYSQDQGYS